LNQPDFLYLTTIGSKTGKDHNIESWFVEHNKRYYVLSEHWNDADWVQNIIHNPRVLFTINDKTLKGSARIVDRGNQTRLADEVLNLIV
jgi:deazaflavin-dependent oxidoreductase (nitroreductase family)